MKARQTLGTAVAAGLVCLVLPTAASASASHPTQPSGLRVTKVSNSWFTVATKHTHGARKYRVFASTSRRDLGTTRIMSAAHSAKSSTPIMTVRHLRYTSAPYYYRVEAINGTNTRFSATIGSVALLPAPPTNLVAVSGSTGTYLTWSAGAAVGFGIEQATDAAMTQNVTNYTTSGTDHVFTPRGLTPGTTYYFRVRGINGTTESSYSTVAQTTPMTAEQPVRVMSYNLLEATDDGRSEGGQTVAPWALRLPAAVALIQKANPDVVAIQEGAAWADSAQTQRQVDSLVTALGGVYSLATTEIPPGQLHYFRTGDYILYKTAEYKTVGAGNYWSLGDTRYAAYQALQNLTSGAQFLMVAPHLAVGSGAAWDTSREAETTKMLADANALAASASWPIVYAGDYNSDAAAGHSFDGPGLAMTAGGEENTYDAAATRTNAQYDSANQYMLTPPQHAEHIDEVYATPGVGASSWSLELNLQAGKFVGVIPSDHNPLVTDLLLPYQPTVVSPTS